MRCDFVYLTKASMAGVLLSGLYFLTKKDSPFSGLACLLGLAGCWCGYVEALRFFRPIFRISGTVFTKMKSYAFL